MSTIRTQQNGMEFTLIQSNNGIRMEYGGVEVMRFWPATGVYSFTGGATVHKVTNQTQMNALALSVGDVVEMTGDDISIVHPSVRVELL